MKTIINLSNEDKKALDMLTYSETANKLKYTEQRTINFYIAMNLIILYYEVIADLSERFKNFKINSGYRCKRTNIAVNGHSLSQHMNGCAADITCDDLSGMWKTIQDMEVDQAIRHKTYIHVSYVTHRLNRNQYIDKTLTEMKGGVKQ